MPVFGAVLWALAGVTRRPYTFERPLTIEVLSSTRFLESATSGEGLNPKSNGCRPTDALPSPLCMIGA